MKKEEVIKSYIDLESLDALDEFKKILAEFERKCIIFGLWVGSLTTLAAVAIGALIGKFLS